MNVTYRLSGRQRKELLARGTSLFVAIPAPADRDYDPLAFARAALPEVRELVVSAEEREISVQPLDRGDAGLASILGGIVQGDRGHDWTVQVAVVIATVRTPGGRPRHQQKWQWPGGAVEFGGRQYGAQKGGDP
ncbi:MAG TPA: hypothetical protein VND64_07850 [Pirellulales bacterium]|nr:hypothetical protein [Pirellulales bacterium]